MGIRSKRFSQAGIGQMGKIIGLTLAGIFYLGWLWCALRFLWEGYRYSNPDDKWYGWSWLGMWVFNVLGIYYLID